VRRAKGGREGRKETDLLQLDSICTIPVFAL
jgi:hypothetical protein